MRQKAIYYLGLCYLKSGMEERAVPALKYVAAKDKEGFLGSSASKVLKTIRMKRKEKRRWGIYLSLAEGYDDNVKLTSEDVATGSDAFTTTTFQAGGAYKLLRAKRYQLSLGLDLYQGINLGAADKNLDEYNLTSLTLPVQGMWNITLGKRPITLIPSYYTNLALLKYDIYSLSHSPGMAMALNWSKTLNTVIIVPNGEWEKNPRL